MLKNYTDNIMHHCIKKPQTNKQLWSVFLMFYIYMVLFNPIRNRFKQPTHKETATKTWGKFQMLAISYFSVGKYRTNWRILDLHWSTVPWRKKNAFINSHPRFQTCTCPFKWHFKRVHAPWFSSLASVLGESQPSTSAMVF